MHGRHGAAEGSAVVSLLQGPGFDPELGIIVCGEGVLRVCHVSVWVSSRFSGFLHLLKTYVKGFVTLTSIKLYCR